MRNNLRIIHIASHKGNVGDLINHNGFYSLLGIDSENIVKIELRDFYYSNPNRKKFDDNFISYINTFDLCVFGGGGFFDVKWPNSETGTTLDISIERLKKIGVPILFNCMGYHEFGNEIDPSVYSKFDAFLSFLLSKKNCLVTLRNDGSKERIVNRFGNKYSHLMVYPDPGFYASPSLQPLDAKRDYYGFCLTNDLFNPSFNRNLNTDLFNKEITSFINNLLERNYDVMLFAHTPADIETINRILAGVSEINKRSKVLVAPYDSSSRFSLEQSLFYYSKCKVFVGMRFHSLITCINLSIPSIALCGHDQIKDLFDKNGLKEYRIVLNSADFQKELSKLLVKLTNDSNGELEKYKRLKEINKKLFADYKKQILALIK